MNKRDIYIIIALLFAICTFSLTGCISFTSRPSIPPEHRPGASQTVTTTSKAETEVGTDTVISDIVSSDSKDEEPSAADDENTVPDITFISVKSDNGEGDEDSLRVTFFDKEGNYYTSDNIDFCILSFEDKIEYFRSGGENIKKLPQTCGKAEIEKQSRLLYGLKSELEYPEVMPAVEAGESSLYGLYYGDDGKLCTVTLHKNKCMTDIYSKDSTANEIYEWYKEAVKIK